MMPNTTAPIGRIASVTVSAKATSGRVRPNDAAMSSMTSVRMKKSNASSVQPRKPARTAWRWLARSAGVIFAAVAAGAVAMSSEEYPTASRRGQLRHRARAGEREVRGAGGEESDEPRVVVQRPERRHDEAAPGERAAERRR